MHKFRLMLGPGLAMLGAAPMHAATLFMGSYPVPVKAPQVLAHHPA